jgi:signal peptidase I
LHSLKLYNDTDLMNPQRPNNLPTPPNQQPGGQPPAIDDDAVVINPHSKANTPYPAPAPAKPPEDPQIDQNTKNDHSGVKSVISTILLLAVAPLIAFAITTFALQSYQVDGESMETTLQNNDRLIVNKSSRTLARITGHQYLPNRGDIIIFNQANLPDTAFGETKQLIKRVVGLPGERVVVQNGKITVYNKVHPSGFNPDTFTGYKIAAKITSGDVDVTLNPNQIFVCGDNRPNSEDSRYFGPITTNDIVGKLVLRLLPANKAEKF